MPSEFPDAAIAHRLRPLRRADEPAVRAIFRSTLALGSPLPFRHPGLDSYERLCLDWYLGEGRDEAVVVEAGGEPVGYLLLCLDDRRFAAWQRVEALRWTADAARLTLDPRCPSAARRFTVLRTLDGLASLGAVSAPYEAHIHTNLLPGHRGRRTVFRLVDHADGRVEAAGLEGYAGEVNVPLERSLHALEAEGVAVLHRTLTRTFTWLHGSPVDRLLIGRSLAERRRGYPR